MSFAALLARFVEILGVAEVPFMVAGSFASTHHGTPRTTQDLDLVIDPTFASLDALLGALPETAYYVSESAARDALRRRSMFNVIDLATGWKIDLIVRKARPFSVEEFGRRTPVKMLGVDVFVATAEDTIVAKLEWAKLSGGSERQLRDVRGILDAKGAALDIAYIEKWVDDLEVRSPWEDPALRA